MHEPETGVKDAPVLMVSYDEKARAALAASSASYGVVAAPCASFREAEDYARAHCCRGVMVDLAAMIKSKDEEKIIAYTLTTLYPSMRVKAMGTMLIPMIMSGDAQQDKSLKDFFTATCAWFTPRRMREHRRRDVCIPSLIGDERGFTTNVSWGGAFIVDTCPQRFSIGAEISVRFLFEPNVELGVDVEVVRLEAWGGRRPPGIGVRFKEPGPDLERNLAPLLRTEKTQDRDRLAK